MRTRDKTNELINGQLGPVHYIVRNTATNAFVLETDAGPFGTCVQSSDYETMVDDISKGRAPKPVNHRKISIRRNVLNTEVYTDAGNTWSVTGSNAHWLSWNPYGDINHGNIDVVWSESELASVTKAKKQFFNMNEVNSFLNIVEAPELITTLPPLYHKINGAIYIDKALDRRDIHKMFKNAKSAIGLLSGGFLYYSFGVAPLISDMRKISKALATFKSKMEKSIARAGALDTVHYKVGGSIGSGLIAGPYGIPTAYGNQGDGSWWHTSVKSEVQPLRIVTIKGTRNQEYFSASFAKLDYLIKRFGGSGPASYLWERIPFSFVVDWFLDLSDVLNNLDNALTGSTKKIQSIELSERWKVLCPIIKHERAPTATSNHDGVQTALSELSIYTRKPIGNNLDVVASGRFGKKQALLTTALVGTFAANLKTKGLNAKLLRLGK